VLDLEEGSGSQWSMMAVGEIQAARETRLATLDAAIVDDFLEEESSLLVFGGWLLIVSVLQAGMRV
jgi:hypothetical protein